jgi:hypothetical protein
LTSVGIDASHLSTAMVQYASYMGPKGRILAVLCALVVVTFNTVPVLPLGILLSLSLIGNLAGNDFREGVRNERRLALICTAIGAMRFAWEWAQFLTQEVQPAGGSFALGLSVL